MLIVVPCIPFRIRDGKKIFDNFSDEASNEFLLVVHDLVKGGNDDVINTNELQRIVVILGYTEELAALVVALATRRSKNDIPPQITYIKTSRIIV